MLVEPVQPFEGGVLHGVEAAPRAAAPDDLRLERRVPALGARAARSPESRSREARASAAPWSQPATATSEDFTPRTPEAVTVDRTGRVEYRLNGNAPIRFGFGRWAWSHVGTAQAPTDPINATAVVDFFSTVPIGVAAYDGHGNDITSAADPMFASGAAYPAHTAATPEPGALAVLGTGLAGVLLVARRRRSA